MNDELTKKALEKGGNANILVNLISRHVRQLNAGAGAISLPLIKDTGPLGLADVALLEIIKENMGWELPELEELSKRVMAKPSAGGAHEPAL